MKQLSLLALFLIITSNTIACGCISEGKLNKRKTKKHELIITGTITKLESDDFNSIFTIEVDKNFKNKENERIVILHTPKGSCELTVEIGQKWLFFANSLHNASYTTDICMRNKIMDSASEFYEEEELKADLDFLRSK
jgi:hypothetical protein